MVIRITCLCMANQYVPSHVQSMHTRKYAESIVSTVRLHNYLPDLHSLVTGIADARDGQWWDWLHFGGFRALRGCLELRWKYPSGLPSGRHHSAGLDVPARPDDDARLHESDEATSRTCRPGSNAPQWSVYSGSIRIEGHWHAAGLIHEVERNIEENMHD